MSTDLGGDWAHGAPHDRAHEDFLVELLADREAPRTETARARLARCETCRLRLSELERLVQRIDDLEAERRAVLASAREAPRDEGFARSLEALRPRPAAPVTAHRIPRRWLIAAAVILGSLAIFALIETRGSKPREDFMLTGAKGQLLSPKGADQSFAVFRWEYPARPGDRCEVTVEVLDAQGRVTNKILGQSEASEWTPTHDQIEAMGRSIRWRVEIILADGESVFLNEVSASSSH